MEKSKKQMLSDEPLRSVDSYTTYGAKGKQTP